MAGETLLTALLAQEGDPVHWIHLSVGGAPQVYSIVDQMADCIVKRQDLSVHLFGCLNPTL